MWLNAFTTWAPERKDCTISLVEVRESVRSGRGPSTSHQWFMPSRTSLPRGGPPGGGGGRRGGGGGTTLAASGAACWAVPATAPGTSPSPRGAIGGGSPDPATSTR